LLACLLVCCVFRNNDNNSNNNTDTIIRLERTKEAVGQIKALHDSGKCLDLVLPDSFDGQKQQ
jgi:hypothetical protein